MYIRLLSLFLLMILSPYANFGQNATQENIQLYPQSYFRNPLNIPILLAGNFGECRPDHFHSGLDIKTNGKENFPVFAAAAGYVSRIKMDKGGFGHALYITHPNGFTTLYAHLNDFNPELQKFLKKTQYEKKRWSVDIALTPEQFPVKKGEQIAWSGNTGGSLAPHLHFEIRDTQTEHPLNPQLFGFDINDTRAPVPEQIAIYNFDNYFYEQTPQYVKLKKLNKNYTTINDTIFTENSEIGLAVLVNDFMNGSANTLNFHTAKWFLDEALQGAITLDNIGYEETRYLNAYADYKTRELKKEWFQCLFRFPGNHLKHLYTDLNIDNGIMNITDEPHNIRMDFTDAAGNKSEINFWIKSKLTISKSNCSKPFIADAPNHYEHPNVKFSLSDKALYDDICFTFDKTADGKNYSDKYQIHKSFVPLHEYFDLFIKPNKPIPFSLRNKIIMMYSDGKNESGKAAQYENGWYECSVRNFGTYYLVADTTAPSIRSLQKQNANLSAVKNIHFIVEEEMTSVKYFHAELDGKWICFEPAGDNFVYEFDEHCPKGKHEISITVKDENDNLRSLIYKFVR